MKLNISIDDVSPHQQSSTKVLSQCHRIIEKYPEAKFTLFVPTAYWRTIGLQRTDSPLPISYFTDFLIEMRQLPKENFEIGYHGHHHGIQGISNNDEFKNLDEEKANEIVNNMMNEALIGNIPFSPIFRPPAWKISESAAIVLANNGIKIFALHPHFKVKVPSGCKVVMANANPPFTPLDPSLDNMELVYHACEWDANYLSNKMVDDLFEFLERKKEIDFCFMGEM